MSIMKKSNHKRTLLVCVLLALVMVVYVYLTDDGLSQPAVGSTPDVSVEAPAEKEPTNPTPAIIGGAAAIGVYYVVSIAIGALKKKNKKETETNQKKEP
ncbi:MAG: hypothetical protein E7445_05820 [Ruminococcaceae bacterium]|nr:hypothetical protein [Oscillospiraceae bacterium]